LFTNLQNSEIKLTHIISDDVPGDLPVMVTMQITSFINYCVCSC